LKEEPLSSVRTKKRVAGKNHTGEGEGGERVPSGERGSASLLLRKGE